MIMQNQGLPLPYGIENLYSSNRHPSQLHADTGLSRYFQRYFIQKIMSVFEWKNLPDEWSVDYFLYSIFLWGYVAIVETKEFGIIPQWCTLQGRDVFYRPTNVVITNPLLKGLLNPRIGVDCALIRMQPDYGGAYDIISYYADLMALCAQTLSINIINSKLSYIGIANNKATAEGLKKVFDKIISGEPAVVVDKEMFTEQGRPLFELFQQNLKENYIAGDLLEDMAKIDSRFCTEIGIPNVNIAKESGVSESEIDANNYDTKSKASIWLETMKKGVEEANRIFGLNIEVEFKKVGGEIDGVKVDTLDSRIVAV